MVREFLKNVSLFNNLTEDDIVQICGMLQDLELPAGAVLFDEGSVGDRAYIIQSGELEIVKSSVGGEVLLAVRGQGEVIGEMSLLEETPRTATVRAHSDVSLVAISKQQFNALLDSSPSAARKMLDIVLARWRHTAATLQQREKMALLGGLVAGVAHELNNPAAATQRSAEQLQGAILTMVRNQSLLADLPVAQRSHLGDLVAKIEEFAGASIEMDSLTRSDRESEIEQWLEGQGVDHAWDYAPVLVNVGYKADDLTDVLGPLDSVYLEAVVGWLCNLDNAFRLAGEISEASRRISEIVQALKTYSYLDQGPVQNVDIHRDLDNTLIILNHKLKDANIQVIRDYAPDLRRIEAYGSELSQVWTNILDNAIDALSEIEDRPRNIVIRTRQEAQEITVEIEDNGPGIPVDVQPKIFDAFFTTKEPGKGTGLGLDISYNIVVMKHGGDLRVNSVPGCTCFQIHLPFQLRTR